jgi:aminoglycoside 3-N-acetyltransferase
VLAEPHHFPKAIYRAVCERGGIGIVSDFVKDPFVTPDGVFWVNSFGESPEWFHGADNRDLLGFCVSPRVGRRLRELLVHGSVSVRAQVQARKVPGTVYAPTGILKGGEKPQEEIWLVAHLYEPLGGDNSPGAAIVMAVARALAELVGRQGWARPRRSIRFVMTLELYGAAALLKTLRERGRKLAATFVVDSSASRTYRSKRPVGFHLSPAVNPLFSDRPLKRAAELCLEADSEVWRLVNGGNVPCEHLEYKFLPGYLGNDAFLGDPMAGGPSFHFWADEGPYWHNSDNTLDMVWPELLAAAVPLHAGLAYYLACLGPDDAAALAELVEEEARQYVAEAYGRFAQGKAKPEELARAVAFRLEMAAKRFENLRWWTASGAGPDDAAQTALGRVRLSAQELLARAGASAKPPQRPLDELSRVDRMCRTAVFRRKEPTFPMSQAFVADPQDRRELSGRIDNVLARMDGRKHLLALLEEEEYFGGGPLGRRRILGDCLFLAERGYLGVELSETVTRDQLVEGIRRSGVVEGDLILAHSSLSAFGHVQGGAEACVDALLEAVGPSGTVLVPAFTSTCVYMEGMLPRTEDVEPFHIGLRRCWTGAVARAFLGRAGVIRSMHPSHSVAGLGPLAARCLDGQRLADPPAGRTSAWARLVELGGKVLYFGAPLSSSTFLHYLETELDMPYMMGGLCCIRHEAGEVRWVYQTHQLGGHREFYRGDWQNAKVFRALADAGLQMTAVRVGLGEIRAVDAGEFARLGRDLMRKDPAILLCERPDCVFCRQASQECVRHGA